MHSPIGPNPNTTANGTRVLWDSARKGKASAAAAVRRLRNQGKWTPTVAADLLAGYDRCLALTVPDTADRFRWAAARAYVVAATSGADTY